MVDIKSRIDRVRSNIQRRAKKAEIAAKISMAAIVFACLMSVVVIFFAEGIFSRQIRQIKEVGTGADFLQEIVDEDQQQLSELYSKQQNLISTLISYLEETPIFWGTIYSNPKLDFIHKIFLSDTEVSALGGRLLESSLNTIDRDSWNNISEICRKSDRQKPECIPTSALINLKFHSSIGFVAVGENIVAIKRHQEDWTFVRVPGSDVQLTGVIFKHEKGWAFTADARIFYSDDSGQSWILEKNAHELTKLRPRTTHILGAVPLSDTRLLFYGGDGLLYLHDVEAKRWEALRPANDTVEGVTGVSLDHPYRPRGAQNPNGRLLFPTSGNQIWLVDNAEHAETPKTRSVEIPCGGAENATCRVRTISGISNSMQLFAFGNDGIVLSSEDYGNEWAVVELPSKNAAAFARDGVLPTFYHSEESANYLTAVGQRGMILYITSTDEDVDIQLASQNFSNTELLHIGKRKNDAEISFIAGSNGTILSRIDDGSLLQVALATRDPNSIIRFYKNAPEDSLSRLNPAFDLKLASIIEEMNANETAISKRREDVEKNRSAILNALSGAEADIDTTTLILWVNASRAVIFLELCPKVGDALIRRLLKFA